MPDDGVARDGFQKLNSIVSSKIIDLLLDLADDFQIRFEKLKLNINIEIVWDFPECISDKNYLILNHILL